jgi:hypothetical protein
MRNCCIKEQEERGQEGAPHGVGVLAWYALPQLRMGHYLPLPPRSSFSYRLVIGKKFDSISKTHKWNDN